MRSQRSQGAQGRPSRQRRQLVCCGCQVAQAQLGGSQPYEESDGSQVRSTCRQLRSQVAGSVHGLALTRAGVEGQSAAAARRHRCSLRSDTDSLIGISYAVSAS